MPLIHTCKHVPFPHAPYKHSLAPSTCPCSLYSSHCSLLSCTQPSLSASDPQLPCFHNTFAYTKAGRSQKTPLRHQILHARVIPLKRTSVNLSDLSPTIFITSTCARIRRELDNVLDCAMVRARWFHKQLFPSRPYCKGPHQPNKTQPTFKPSHFIFLLDVILQNSYFRFR